MTPSLLDYVPRVRLTRRDPFGSGTRTGLIVWVGSLARGWVGKPVNPVRWNETWRIRSAS